MSGKVLVTIGVSPISSETLKVADTWAQAHNAELKILHIMLSEPYLSEPGKAFDAFMKKQEIVSPFEIIKIFGPPVGQKIVAQAEKIKPDLIVMADHSHNITMRFFLGSTTNHVLHYAQFPLYIHKKPVENTNNIILAPTDFSEMSKKAVLLADEMATKTNATLHLVHINPKEWVYSSWGSEFYGVDFRNELNLKEENRKLLNQLEELGEELHLNSKLERTVRAGTPHIEILKIQEELGACMIVNAAHSYSWMDRILLGSTTDYLLNHAKVPLLIHKEPAQEKSEVIENRVENERELGTVE